MTTINAMAFDAHSGVLVCDEARTWDETRYRLYTADKMRPLTSPEVQAATGAVVLMGKTGTSTLGNEYLEAARRAVSERFEAMAPDARKKRGRPKAGDGAKGSASPALRPFLSVKEIALTMFRAIIAAKRAHIDHVLRARFGFTSDDFVAGVYEGANGDLVPITDEGVVAEAHRLLTGADGAAQARPVFGNSQIVAGFSPNGGFRMYRSSLDPFLFEPVHEVFTVFGSGMDSTDLSLTPFANRCKREAGGVVDPVEGVAFLLEALGAAYANNAGCAGDPKLHLIDGRKPLGERYRAIVDGRGRLALEIVLACREGFLARPRALPLLEKLVFEDAPFSEVEARFRREGEAGLPDFLRGYRAH